MAKITRDKTSFTGVLGAEKFDTLASLKDAESIKYQWVNAKNEGGGHYGMLTARSIILLLNTNSFQDFQYKLTLNSMQPVILNAQCAHYQ
ncbi:hypothetical protein [Helicobacter turcicus]|uniref:hypothetical protein n=1 Tax=Helicobacter turcicus TaxID=2867412 RepID=UPI001F394C28|nr:hypothetical protein [Helicobacter turcicus]